MSWDIASEAQRRKAADRAAAVGLVADRMARNCPQGAAIRAVAAEVGVTEGALRKWVARAAEASAARHSVTAALVDRPRRGRPAAAWRQPGAEEAFRRFERLYLHEEARTAASCFRLVQRLARLRGWQIPSCKTFERRLVAETEPLEVIRSREGRIAALAAIPHQERTVEGMAPLDWVNGDGYLHNLFVTPPGGGKPVRPRTWAWQDVRTRRVLAWRSGLTESADLVRLSFHELATRYGVPGVALLDNTLAASERWFGGPSRRWRVDREDVPSILGELGVRPVRTGIEKTSAGKGRGRGQAKPVERQFKDWGEVIDKDPRAEGAWTGPNPLAKPETYGTAAIGWELFEQIVAENIAALNAQPGRRTEAAAGRSFDETWETEFALVAPARLTRVQETLLLMAGESTSVDRAGAFRLRAGKAIGLPPNRYSHPGLLRLRGKRVVVRFHPDRLHDAVDVFHKGAWICRADCIAPTGFGDTDAARDFNRARRAEMRSADRAHRAREQADDLRDMHVASAPRPAPAPAKVVRMVPQTISERQRRTLEERMARGLAKAADL